MNNEWDRFVSREEVITALPAPLSSDLDSTLNETDRVSTHNQFWNWGYVYSWCKETCAAIASFRGYSSARYYDWYSPSGRDVLTAVESIDGVTKNTFSPTRNTNYNIAIPVNTLALGKHTIKVAATDWQGGSTARTWTFTRTNSTPDHLRRRR